jgi:hypothetical protein
MKNKKALNFERLAIAILLMVSFVTMSAYTADVEKPELTASSKGQIRNVNVPTSPEPRPKSQNPIIWDNGGSVAGSYAFSSQNDAVYPFVSQTADDFMFTQNMLVTDVHWWGEFWNGPPDEVEPCDFQIYIYADDGTGTMPTGAGMADPSPTALASYHFTGVSGLPLDANGFYEYDVDLSPSFSAAAGVKYWIAIQADFTYPPQWGWIWTNGIQLHQAMQGFPLLGTPFWTDPSPPGLDMAFYLTGVPANPWPDHKMHFPQLPDLIGWDVNATMPMILADDWQCSQTGWVTDIHFWGSWKDLDGIPATDDFFTPMPFFVLSIHENIPADPDTPWSRPGRQVWGWAGEIQGVPSEPPTLESWYDPATGAVFPNDHIPYWQYDFFVANANPPADSFFQYEGQIYWLNVSAVNIPQPYLWGWKNSTDHFMDDAVYSVNGPAGPWYPIEEPERSNWFDVSFDDQGLATDMGSTNFYGDGWYRYEYWTNMWFYDNPFTFEHPKNIYVSFYAEPVPPNPYAEFAINWTTPAWDSLEMGRPPLPGEDEMLYIGRQIFTVLPGQNDITFNLPYNPEWVSLDFMATDVIISGWIHHECVGTSLDLSFVITGHEGEPPSHCGDVTNDGVVDAGDVVYMVNYLYRSGPIPMPQQCVGDVNNDNVVDAGDVVYLINYLYRSGTAPDPNCCNPPWKK